MAPYENGPIQIITDREGVRMRPQMYIGDLSNPTILNLLIAETLCIGLDEAISGHCNKIDITVDEYGLISTKENGRGLSMAINEHGITEAEVIFSTLLPACREKRENKSKAHLLCHIGVFVVNVFSEYFKIINCRDGKKWQQEYRYGEKQSDFILLGETDEQGTTISFKPDRDIIRSLKIDSAEISSQLSQLELDICSLQVTFSDPYHGILRQQLL